MITEDYVSFETAKLLKEKGFDVYGDGSYNSGIEIYKEYSPFGKLNSCTTSKPHREAYAAPTLQMAMKWLREVHNIFIDISSRFSKNADKDVCFSYSCKKLIDTYKSSYEIGDGEWLTYEEACEAAIKYCLENLI